MSLDKLKAVVEKELSNRKIYEEANAILDALANTSNWEKELKLATAAAQKELSAIQSDIETEKKELANVKEKSKETLEAANKKAADIISQANDEATAFLGKAQADKDNIDTANSKAADDLKVTLAKIEAAQKELDTLEKAIGATKTKLKTFME